MIPQLIISPQSLDHIPATPDTLVAPDEPHLKIAFVRELQQFISTGPIQAALKIISIPRAERLTLPAQNALLKTLEESPDFVQIILQTAHRDQLLSTIISRCQVILKPLPETVASVDRSLIVDLNRLTLPERMALADTYAKNRELATETCLSLINALRPELFTFGTIKTAARLKLLNEGMVHLTGNANPHLTLEHIFIHWND